MFVPIAYVLIGLILMVGLVNDLQFAKTGLLPDVASRVVFVFAWPAMLFTMLLFPFCRPEGSDPKPVL